MSNGEYDPSKYDWFIVVTYEDSMETFAAIGDLDAMWKGLKFRKGKKVISILVEGRNDGD